jgi:hypothetical protein
MLDIGGHTGAVILYTPAALLGHEIDLWPSGPGRPTHSAVRERHVGPAKLCAAVWPALDAGTYVIAGTNRGVVVHGGQITELQW